MPSSLTTARASSRCSWGPRASRSARRCASVAAYPMLGPACRNSRPLGCPNATSSPGRSATQARAGGMETPGARLGFLARLVVERVGDVGVGGHRGSYWAGSARSRP